MERVPVDTISRECGYKRGADKWNSTAVVGEGVGHRGI